MVGKEENLAPAWEELRKHIKLDPPTQLHESVYLGCGQRNSAPDKQAVDKMSLVFEKYSKTKLTMK